MSALQRDAEALDEVIRLLEKATRLRGWVTPLAVKGWVFTVADGQGYPLAFKLR
jgi:hypothetical protein